MGKVQIVAVGEVEAVEESPVECRVMGTMGQVEVEKV